MDFIAVFLKRLVDFGFGPFGIFMLILAILAAVLAVLGPKIGLSKALRIIFGFAAAVALLLFLINVGGGSAAPKLTRIIFINQTDRPVLRVRVDKIPNPEDPPGEEPMKEPEFTEPIPPQQQAFIACEEGEYFWQSFRQGRVTVEQEGGPPMVCEIGDQPEIPPGHLVAQVLLVFEDGPPLPPRHARIGWTLFHADDDINLPFTPPTSGEDILERPE